MSIGPVDMNKYARFDEIPSRTLKDIKETKRYGRTDGRTDRQRENSIPSHKHSLRGVYTLIELAPSPFFFAASICPVNMNVYARFDEILSITL